MGIWKHGLAADVYVVWAIGVKGIVRCGGISELDGATCIVSVECCRITE